MDAYPSIPTDRIDLSVPLPFESFTIEHKRNGVIIEREIIATKYMWNLIFRNISQAMMVKLRDFAKLYQLRLYPDSDNPLYYDVYWITKFNSTSIRGGTHSLSATLLQR